MFTKDENTEIREALLLRKKCLTKFIVDIEITKIGLDSIKKYKNKLIIVEGLLIKFYSMEF